jgi:hypothetical protein
VIVGDLTLLHRSGLAGPKAVYLAAVALSAVAAIPAVRDAINDPERHNDRRLVFTTAAFGAVAFLSLPVALHYGNDPVDWIRDVSVYGLLAVAPVLAIDLRRAAGIRWISWSLIATGTAATLSFAVEWMKLRGYATLPLRRSGLLLPSFYLPAALLSFVSARAIGTVGRERAAWTLSTLMVFAAVAGTGTRTALILVAAPLTQLGLSRHRRAVALVVSVVVVAASALALAANRGIDLGPLGNRLASSATFVRHPTRDPSWQERSAEATDAFAAWRQSPIVGVGAGHRFHWRTFAGVPQTTFLIDAPTGFLAKFGLVGVIVLLAFSVALAMVVREHLRSEEPSAVLPMVGLIAVSLCGFAFGMPLEDKGFPIAFLLTYALTLPGMGDAPLPTAERRRRALRLTAVVAVGCALGAVVSGRVETAPALRPSILGAIPPPVRVIALFQDAMWEGDGVRACDLLAPPSRASYGSLQHCRTVLSTLSRHDPGEVDSRASAPVPVAGSAGNTLRVTLQRRNGHVSRYVVTRNYGGKWLVLGFR